VARYYLRVLELVFVADFFLPLLGTKRRVKLLNALTWLYFIKMQKIVFVSGTKTDLVLKYQVEDVDNSESFVVTVCSLLFIIWDHPLLLHDSRSGLFVDFENHNEVAED